MIQAGQKLGEFEILEQIGRGGMGAVYKARQTTLRRFVAIKILQPSLAANSQYIIRFNNEAVAAAGLNHPNLVQVYSAGETDGVHWFAMEFVEGETVRERFKRKGRIEPAEAIAIATYTATALEYGWRKAQLIHRDIKPDNIFLSQDGEVKLGDLGLAKSSAQDDGLTHTGASMGTPRYISPEQAQGKKDIDLRADIYSLGCTLFHLLSGQQPYVAENAVEMMLKHVTEPVPALRSVWPECPAELSRVVMKMMAKPPAARQQTHGEVIADLRRAHDALTGASMPDVITLSQPPPGRSLKKVAIFSLPDPPARPAARAPAPAARQPAVPKPVPKLVVTPQAASDLPSAVPKPKSKVLLWSGIAAILAVVLWFAFGKKEPQRSEAERAKKAREQAAATGRPIAKPAVEPWQDVLHDPAKLDLSGKVERTPEGLRFTDLGAAYLRNRRPQRDGAVRMRAAFGGLRVQLRARMDATAGVYQLYAADEKRIILGCWDKVADRSTNLREFSLREPLQAGQDYELELRVVGQTLTTKLNGEVLGTVTGGTSAEGRFGLEVTAQNAAPALIKSLEVLNLDAPAAPSAFPISPPSLTATKEAPFVNSLGMKFVPVPGTKTLFSVWDTRVQDYTAYAKANKVDASWTRQEKDGVPVGREPEHPVCGVNWNDANAFCKWLTEKESAEGKLPKGAKYRLPTDEEWSRAVGLPPEPGATPSEKSGKNKVNFPWGTDFPPKEKVGNYADTAFHEKFPNAVEKWMGGYTDGFAGTSPVGSFPANGFGLYDMGGNVWRWCEDWFDASQKDRVVRGASWNRNDRGTLLSSYRDHLAPTLRHSFDGFRCVLEPAPSTVTTAATTPTTATKDAPFVNSLGMKFVPVPGTEVLFSIWDTRVRDYTAYAKANKVDASWTRQEKDGVPVGREPEHPVCGVSWDDANAFCKWLTEMETAEAKLAKGAKYRLPTDEEWSRAVGLASEQGATPAEKNGKNGVDFPWGIGFPPKGKVGNYADSAFHEKFPNERIESYTDGFATTSPVGSFPANAYGLYDMGGNVWQWCEDWFDASQKHRVLRGGSWTHIERTSLRSSDRYHNPASYRTNNYGFRCVLAESVR